MQKFFKTIVVICMVLFTYSCLSNKKPQPNDPSIGSNSFFYLAIGDSVLIDKWPANNDPNCKCGGASLLYKNLDNKYPNYKNKDLVSIFPNAKMKVIAQDGATIDNLLNEQFSQIKKLPVPDLLTLSIGGNDIVHYLYKYIHLASEESAYRFIDSFGKKLKMVQLKLRSIVRQNPEIIVVILNIYDPTDGTGFNFYTGEFLSFKKKKIIYNILNTINDQLRFLSNEENFIFIDIHKHFLGHGIFARAPQTKWYHPKVCIDVNKLGAHKLRTFIASAIFSKKRIASAFSKKNSVLALKTQQEIKYFDQQIKTKSPHQENYFEIYPLKKQDFAKNNNYNSFSVNPKKNTNTISQHMKASTIAQRTYTKKNDANTCKQKKLKANTHTQRTQTIKADKRVQKMKLINSGAILNVITNPLDAKIRILNIGKNIKYMKNMKLPSKLYKFEISKKGFRTEVQYRYLTNGLNNIEIELKRCINNECSNRFYVTSFPKDVSISFKQLNVSYSEGMKLKKGTYSFDVSKKGYKTGTEKFYMNDSDLNITVILTKKRN